MTPAERARLAHETAARIIGKRTDIQVVEDLTVACIENRRRLADQDWGGLDHVNITIRWLEDEIDRRFPCNAERIIERAWEIADRG